MFFFFPVRDEYGVKRFPIIVTLIIFVNCLIYFIFGFTPQYEKIVLRYGFIPADFSFKTIITSMFLHGGLFHLGFNMWYLWLLGDNIEDRWGRINFLFFYLLSGISSAILYSILIPPKSLNIPVIGASGAISGILGAYAILFPKSRITFKYFAWFFLIFIRVGEFEVYSYIWLFFWFFIQGLNTLFVSMNIAQSQVAYAAHFGGFLFGVIIGLGTKLYREAKHRENIKLGENMLLQLLGKKEERLYTVGELKEIEEIKNKIISVIYEDRVLATQIYNRGIEKFPDICLNEKTQYKIAESLYNQGDYTSAMIAYKNFILNYPLSKLADNALLSFGKICLKIGDYEKAKQAFLQIVLFYPYSDVYEESKYYLEKELPNILSQKQ
ncbi:MAG: rhomboid family intramembrane serine protease [bacterium]|nr:rhomboid family intramembrane serine protease [bacterium]MCX7917635.1 rhomboid family intramembrane serine protease [bacterium]MDW8164764.1 rhomboid family intramembrane serine protease [Candidatus Omnitrophota bacterium]